MNATQFARDDDQLVRRYEYDDSTVLAIDFGGTLEQASAEVVDGTLLVVVGDDQHELEVPADATDAHTFIKNGVLTIEMEDTR